MEQDMNAAATACEDAAEAQADSVTSNEQTEEMIAALEGLRSFYDMLASIYFKPLTADQIENIAELDLTVYAGLDPAMDEGFNDVSRYLRKRNTGTRQELAVDFTASFGGTSSWKGKYAVPYESVFTSEEGLMYQGAYHEVYHLFKKNRVARAEGYDYPDDHLSFMFEFLNIVSRRTIECLQENDAPGALKQVKIAKEFIEQHIVPWFPRLKETALLLISTRFYRGILKITEGFVRFHISVLDDIAAVLEAESEPAAEER